MKVHLLALLLVAAPLAFVPPSEALHDGSCVHQVGLCAGGHCTLVHPMVTQCRLTCVPGENVSLYTDRIGQSDSTYWVATLDASDCGLGSTSCSIDSSVESCFQTLGPAPFQVPTGTALCTLHVYGYDAGDSPWATCFVGKVES